MFQMSTEPNISLRWQINFKIVLFAVIFFPITLMAGFWQLSRAEEKRDMLDEQSARSNLPPIAVTDLDLAHAQNYRPVTLMGRWEEGYFLLENRVKNGRPGYEVLGIFSSNDAKVLVNRGWVQGSLNREILPEIEFDSGNDIRLLGYAYRSASKPFTLGEPIWTDGWPERIQAINWDQLSGRLGYPLFPYLVRLDASSASAYSTGWLIVNLPPQKHTAYALQWFALAILLIVLTIFACSNLGAVIKQKLGTKE